MKAGVRSERNGVQGASAGHEPERLDPMAIATDRLQIRILERGAAGGDLHDMVDIQLACPSATVADLAGVAVPEHDVGPR